MIDKTLLEQACRENNREALGSMIESAESDELKKQVFLQIIEYYSANLNFPVGYVLIFIKWLLQKQDRATAMEQILRCRKMGVPEERLSGLIYEYLIKPKELYFREKFNKNLQLLQSSRIFFTNSSFDFDQIKKDISVIAGKQPDLPDILVQQEGKTFLLVDVTDTEVITNSLEKKNALYLVYENLRKFYYMLFFEDLSVLSKYMERHVEQNLNHSRIIFFAGCDTEFFQKFLSNPMVISPNYCINRSSNKTYCSIIESITERIDKNTCTIKEELALYYKRLNHQYYENLFLRSPSDIKILLCVSEGTELNKFIVKNWHKAFLELGYRSELLIEREPYELLNEKSITERIYTYKPDILFMINWVIDSFIQDADIRKNLLWIMRYRDAYSLSYADKNYEDYCNMFISPILFEWTEQLKRVGVPENRIYNTSDGVDISIFSKNDAITSQYACDIVCVNNSGGSELTRLDYWLRDIKNERTKLLFKDLYEELKEKAFDNMHLHLPDNIRAYIDKKIFKLRDIDIPASGKKYLVDFCTHMLDSICRTIIMEWVIDSGITNKIRLWGKGWINKEKFRKFHMGTARHGRELANIYRSSSISMSDNLWSLHERNFEILASGGFPLIRYVRHPEVEERNKITNYFKENEEGVLFYSKDDLLNKIQYYLDNPSERERIAENGRQVVINNFSHVAIARKTMNFIKGYYLAGDKRQKA